VALSAKSSVLDDILFVVVTCTRDRSRERALRKLVKSIEKQHARVGFNGNLVLSLTLVPVRYGSRSPAP